MQHQPSSITLGMSRGRCGISTGKAKHTLMATYDEPTMLKLHALARKPLYETLRQLNKLWFDASKLVKSPMRLRQLNTLPALCTQTHPKPQNLQNSVHMRGGQTEQRVSA